MYKKALEIEPNNADYLANCAGVLLIRGKDEGGCKLLNKIFMFVDKQSVLLECWFYSYAHTKDEEIKKQSLDKIKNLVESGTRSPGWNLEYNVETAIKCGHPEPEFLKKLSNVISDDVAAKELDTFKVWLVET